MKENSSSLVVEFERLLWLPCGALHLLLYGWLRTKISWYSMRVVSQALRFCWILAVRARGDVIKKGACLPGLPEDWSRAICRVGRFLACYHVAQ